MAYGQNVPSCDPLKMIYIKNFIDAFPWDSVYLVGHTESKLYKHWEEIILKHSGQNVEDNTTPGCTPLNDADYRGTLKKHPFF